MNPELSSKIEELDSLTGAHTQRANNKVSRSYLDDMGRETFYVHNKSRYTVCLSEGIPALARGEVRDLLEYIDIEDITKNRTLRKVISDPKVGVHRLTQEEYFKALADKEDMEERIAASRVKQEQELLSKENDPSRSKGDKSNEPRLYVKDMVDRLQRPKHGSKEFDSIALSDAEFMAWAATEPFTLVEADYIIGAVDSNEVKSFMYQVKSRLVGEK